MRIARLLLRYIATHIGRSHKRNLSPRERHEQIVAGQCCCPSFGRISDDPPTSNSRR